MTTLPAQTLAEPLKVRDYQRHKYVYVGLAPRAHGLFIGINLNPMRECNFSCAYCEVRKPAAEQASFIDLNLLADELTEVLHTYVAPPSTLPLEESGLRIRHVAISGEGEPTLCPQFQEAIETLIQVRALNPSLYFKLVLYTNGAALDRPNVIEALNLLTPADEIWIKLDAGTPEHFQQVSQSTVPFATILDNILLAGRRRPVVIQSCFPAINKVGPTEEQILAYADCLNNLKERGAKIDRVQVYSSTRPAVNKACTHLNLKALSAIARKVRGITGLEVEVY